MAQSNVNVNFNNSSNDWGDNHFIEARDALKLTPQEQNLYQMHLSNLMGSGKVRNPDGSISTLFQETVEHDGYTYNIPTVWEGKKHSPSEAVKHASSIGWNKFPAYASEQEAENRYQLMHRYMEQDVKRFLSMPVTIDLNKIKAAVPEARGWTDERLMQYYYWTQAQPKGMSWQAFADSVGYKPPPAPTLRQRLDTAWGHFKDFALAHPLLSAPLAGTYGVTAEAGKVLTGVADVAQAGLGNLLASGAADITATTGALFRGTQDIPEAAADIEKRPFFQGMEATLTPQGKEMQEDITSLASHLPDFGTPLSELTAGAAEQGALKLGLSPKTADTLAALGSAAGKTAPAAASLLLMSDNPLTRTLTRTVSEPLQAAAGRGFRAVLEQTESGRAFLASRRVEDRMLKHRGTSEAITDEANQIAQKWHDLPLTAEDRIAIAAYQEDPTGTFPLSSAQRTAYEMFYPKLRMLGWNQGYMHRITALTAEGGPGRIVRTLRGGEESPTLAPRVSLQEGAGEERQMFKLVPVGHSDAPPAIAYVRQEEGMGAGERRVTGISGDQNFEVGTLNVTKERPVAGQEITDPTGQRWRIEQATRAEVEAQSRVVYHKDFGVSLAEAWRQHFTRIATEDLLNDLKTNPDFYGLIQKMTGSDRPGWAKFKNPWLKDYWAPRRLTQTIDTLLGQRGFDEVLKGLNTTLLRANFIINIWHGLNIGAMGIVEAGSRLLTSPSRLLAVSEDWGKALNQVVGGGRDFNALLRDGFPFMSRRTLGKEIYQHVISSLVREVDGPYLRELVRQGRLDASTLAALGDGLKGMVKRGAGNAQYGLDVYEGWPIWTMDDMVKLRAVYARMGRTGEDLLTAGRKVKGDFPQYFIRYSTPGLGPVLDSLQRTGLVWFMPYHVDRLAILGRRLAKAATLDPQALGQLLASYSLLTVVYPSLDEAVQKLTNNPKAHEERFGSERVLQQAAKVASHQASIGSLLSVMFTPSAPVSILSDRQQARGEAVKSAGTQTTDFLLSQAQGVIYPAEVWDRNSSLYKNLQSAFLSQLGVEGLGPSSGGPYHPYKYQTPKERHP